MSKDDFTEEELKLLVLIFRAGDTIIENLRYTNCEISPNDMYNLEQKLGIYDILEEY